MLFTVNEINGTTFIEKHCNGICETDVGGLATATPAGIELVRKALDVLGRPTSSPTWISPTHSRPKARTAS
jgi:hypothetical protein